MTRSASVSFRYSLYGGDKIEAGEFRDGFLTESWRVNHGDERRGASAPMGILPHDSPHMILSNGLLLLAGAGGKSARFWSAPVFGVLAASMQQQEISAAPAQPQQFSFLPGTRLDHPDQPQQAITAPTGSVHPRAAAGASHTAALRKMRTAEFQHHFIIPDDGAAIRL